MQQSANYSSIAASTDAEPCTEEQHMKGSERALVPYIVAAGGMHIICTWNLLLVLLLVLLICHHKSVRNMYMKYVSLLSCLDTSYGRS